MKSQYSINCQDYWNWRYKSNWEEFRGSLQTEYFAKLLIGNIPNDIFIDIFNNNYNMIDFGSGKGQLCYEWSKTFHTANITGLDFSDVAIKQAEQLYPKLEFTSSPLSIEDKYYILVTSNTLEHLTDWKNYLDLFSIVAQKYIIILVPYENEIFDGHVVSFNGDNFPNRLNEFSKVLQKVINTDDSGFWNGNQLLVIYKKG